MRHNKKFNHLGRTASHRQAMLANMTVSLIMHKRITTTLAKAKALKKYAEPLITKSKEDTTNSRRVVFSYLQDKVAITELFTVVAQKVGDRPGGYTRIIKTGFRPSDNAPMCFIELVDFDELSAPAVPRRRTPRQLLPLNPPLMPQPRLPQSRHLLRMPSKARSTYYKDCNNVAALSAKDGAVFLYAQHGRTLIGRKSRTSPDSGNR